MNTEASVHQDVRAELQQEMSNIATPISAPDNADAARSKENILRWTAYLPKSCIKAMIKMGWDETT